MLVNKQPAFDLLDIKQGSFYEESYQVINESKIKYLYK